MIEDTSHSHKQDLFLSKMIEDYNNNIIPNSSIYKKYFEWKIGVINHRSINLDEVYTMIDDATIHLENYYQQYPNAFSNKDEFINNDVWQKYKGFGKDKFIVSYYEAIIDELTNIIEFFE